MRRPRIGRLKWLALVPVSLPLVWVLALAVVPTGWARTRLESALRDETGHEVRLGEVRLGLLGEVRLKGLELIEPREGETPWLTAESVRIDLRVWHLLAGWKETTRVEARGVAVTLDRPVNGAFPCCSLLRSCRPPSEPGLSDDPDSATSGETSVSFRLSDSRVSVTDAASGTRVELTGLSGSGLWEGRHVRLDMLAGRINDGPFELEADLDRAPSGPRFEAELRARNVELGEGSNLLGHLVPMLTGSSGPSGLNGRMDLTLYLSGRGDTTGDIASTLVGRGAIRLDPIGFDDRGLIAELDRVLKLPPQARVAAVRGPFTVGKGRVATEDLTIELGSLPVRFSGWAEFAGPYDYRLESDDLARQIAPEVHALLPELPVRMDEVLDLRVRGVVGGAPRVSIGGVALGVDADGNPMSRKDRIRDLTRRLRDRVLR
jgi:AsmA protein